MAHACTHSGNQSLTHIHTHTHKHPHTAVLFTHYVPSLHLPLFPHCFGGWDSQRDPLWTPWPVRGSSCWSSRGLSQLYMVVRRMRDTQDLHSLGKRGGKDLSRLSHIGVCAKKICAIECHLPPVGIRSLNLICLCVFLCNAQCVKPKGHFCPILAPTAKIEQLNGR